LCGFKLKKILNDVSNTITSLYLSYPFLVIPRTKLGQLLSPQNIFKTKVEKFYLFLMKFSSFKKKNRGYGIWYIWLVVPWRLCEDCGMIDEHGHRANEARTQLGVRKQAWPWQRLIIMQVGYIVNFCWRGNFIPRLARM